MPQPVPQASPAGRTVWLTRPHGQADALCATLEQAGCKVLLLPLLEISPRKLSPEDRQKLIDLDQYDLVFYVSTNAATFGLDAIGQWWPQYPSHIRNFAVGPTTAAVLEKHGLAVHFPRAHMNSEALLALPELQRIDGNKALIIRGAGGREVIAAGLRERGARVDYAQLYARSMPHYDSAWLQDRLTRTYPDAIVISSAEALDNLKQLFAPLQAHWQKLPLLLASPRLDEHARRIGFTRTRVMADATDAAIIQALQMLPDRPAYS